MFTESRGGMTDDAEGSSTMKILPETDLCPHRGWGRSIGQRLGYQRGYMSRVKDFRYRRRVNWRNRPPGRQKPTTDDCLQGFVGFSTTNRTEFLSKIVQCCSTSEILFLNQLTDQYSRRDFLAELPRELAHHLLTFLSAKDLVTASHVSSLWRRLSSDTVLWQEKLIEERLLPSDRPRDAFLSALWRERSWCERDAEPLVLVGHDEHVITCLECNGDYIVSGSDDGTLRVWGVTPDEHGNGQFHALLTGHAGGVWASVLQGNLLISGSTDRTLKAWDIETGTCLQTMVGHHSTVRCLAMNDNKVVVSGSRDATLRLWDVTTGETLHQLVGHSHAVRCVGFSGKLVVSGAYDCLIKVWEPESETCLFTLNGHTQKVYSLLCKDNYIISGSLDSTIRVWDVRTGKLQHTLEGHQSLTSGLELQGDTLISANADSSVKLWDLRTGECIRTLSGAQSHESAVTSVQLIGRHIITSSDDGTVKLWNSMTGELVRNLVSLLSARNGGVVWRVLANQDRLIAAVGSRNGTEDTKLLVLDFTPEERSGPPGPLSPSFLSSPTSSVLSDEYRALSPECY